MKLYCKFDDTVLDGERQPGTPYGQACPVCGRYTQSVTHRELFRSAISGEFISRDEALGAPKTSVKEKVATTKSRRKAKR